MPDQAAIVQELYNRIDTLPPDKAAVVSELARRFGVQRVPDATANLHGLGDKIIGSGDNVSMGSSSPYPLTNPEAARPVTVNPHGETSWFDPSRGVLTAKNGAGLAANSKLGSDDQAEGVHQVIAGTLDAAKPTMLLAGAAAPIATGVGLGVGTLAQKGVESGAETLGVSPGYTHLLGDAAGLVAGGAAGHGYLKATEPIRDFGLPFYVPKGGDGGGAPLGAGLVGALIRPNLDPSEAAAVQYGRENGVPMRLSTQTGSKVALGAEKLAGHLPLMDTVADEARTAERAGIQSAGAREVAALNPDAPQGATPPTPLDAGEAIHKAAIEKEAGHSSAADDAYGIFRSIEAQPAFSAEVQTGTRRVLDSANVDESGNPVYKDEPVTETIAAPVDRRPAKLALKPLLDRMLRLTPLAQEQSSIGIKALRNIVEGPDFESASVTDEDLGAIKGILREKTSDRSRGLAKFAVDQLSKAVDAAAERMGPDAVAALKRGREETINKYEARDYQSALGFKNVGMGTPEPGSAVDLVTKLTAAGDRNIDLLRQVAQHTPEHIPALAQAAVQSLIDTATADGGMSLEKTALRKFMSQGAETKKILYGDSAQRIQNFFALNERLARNPNPSGTGPLLALAKGGAVLAGVVTAPVSTVATVGGYLIAAKPLARMLFNPETSRLMQAALKLPRDAKGADLLGAQLAKAATAAGATPAAAGAGAGAAGATMGSPDTFVTVPGEPGNVYRATYKVVERSSLQASHSGKTFNANPNYPLQNDRDYTTAGNQGPVIGWSSRAHFDPKQLVNDNPNADNGPLVTDAQGNVLGGNGRAMILERVHSDPQHPGIAAYRELLAKKAAQFGIDPASLEGMKEPVLVREVADSEFAGRTKQQAISDFNKSGIKEMTPSEKAIKDANRVSPETLEHFASLLENHRNGSDATVADVLADHGQDVLNRLIKDGVITDQERNALEGAQGLTDEGKDRIGLLMAGRFFEDSKVLDSIQPSIRGKVTRLAAPFAQVQGRGEWNLTPAMRDAVNILHQAQAHKQTAADFIAQDGLFGKQKYSAESQALANAVQKLNPTELVAAARQYAQDANDAAQGDGLFGAAPTPAESFDAAFGEKAVDAAIERRQAKKNALAGEKATNTPAPANALTSKAEQQAAIERRRDGQRGSIILGGPKKNALDGEAGGDLPKSREVKYVRFGDIPEGGQSRNHMDGRVEAGVSAYRLVRVGGKWLIEDAFGSYRQLRTSGRPLYEVSGREIGSGADGEPLLADAQIVRKMRDPGFGDAWQSVEVPGLSPVERVWKNAANGKFWIAVNDYVHGNVVEQRGSAAELAERLRSTKIPASKVDAIVEAMAAKKNALAGEKAKNTPKNSLTK